MKIPVSFTTQVANAFYDKVVTIYTKNDVVDEEGFAYEEETETETTFNGNVRFDNLAELQEDYGLEEVIDISITTDTDIEVGTIVGYDDVLYRVMKAIPFDSHNLLIGKKWLSKSSALISV